MNFERDFSRVIQDLIHNPSYLMIAIQYIHSYLLIPTSHRQTIVSKLVDFNHLTTNSFKPASII